MTPALKAMVEAMAAELERQAEDADGVRGGVVYQTGPGEYTIDARGVDVEKVARAGLAATDLMALGTELRSAASNLVDSPLGRRGAWSAGVASDKLAAWADRIDAILKEVP